MKERVRVAGWESVVEAFLQDLRFAVRMLGKNPGFTIVAVLTLALGIGATTAIFSVVNKVLLQPLPYPHSDRIVALMLSAPQGTGSVISIPEFMVLREQTRVFQYIAAYDLVGTRINLTGGDRPEQLIGRHVSADYFRVFGLPVTMGRTFTLDEDRPGGPKVVVVSNGLWRSKFGGDPNLVGRSILLAGEPYSIIGVLGPAFTAEQWQMSDIWLPLQADPNSNIHAYYLYSAGLLKSGITLENSNAELKIAAQEFRRKFPSPGIMRPDVSFIVQPLREPIVGSIRPALLILFGAVGFVLLIACANVANLLLARGSLRKRELAVRAALGAGRRRIIRQLLTESILLSLVAGAFGLALGYFGVHVLLAINPGNIPRIGERGSGIGPDWRVFVFTLLISLSVGIFFGLLPALDTSRADISTVLKESGSRSNTGRRERKVLSILVIVEMAFTLVLLSGAALLIRTYKALRTVDPGFDGHNVLTMDMSLAEARLEKAAEVAQLVHVAEQRVESLPGVAAMALTCSLPLEPHFGMPFTIEGRPLADSPYHGGGGWRSVSPGFFEVFRIPLLRGRLLNDRDDGKARLVVLVNDAMAKEYWPNGDVLGARITIGKGMGSVFEESPREVVGVVGNVRDGGLNFDPFPTMYVPIAQVTDGVTALTNRNFPSSWVFRTNVQPFSLNKELQRELRTASGGLPIGQIRSMDQVVAQSTARADFNTTLLTVFAGVALFLAAIGIYGLMAYSVRQRTQEIGIRTTLGAQRNDILKMVVGDGVKLALTGMAIGIAGALALTRVLSSLLFGVRPTDPVTFISVSLVLLGVTLLACYIPARRATHLDPTVALRHE